MPLSSHLAPGFTRLTYSGTGRPHHQIIPIKFAGTPTPGVSPEILPTSGTPIDVGGAVLLYLAEAWAPQFPSSVKAGLFDVYAVDPETGVRTFIFAGNGDTVGTSIETQVAQSEAVWVFKSTVGRPIKVWLMEATYAFDARNVGVVPADGRQAMVDYILGADNMFYGRTDAYPLAFQTFTSKENDVLRRNGGFFDL